MARPFSLPSFSLGLGFDHDDDDEEEEPKCSPKNNEKDHDDKGFDDVDLVPSSPPVVKLKRLRRGSSSGHGSTPLSTTSTVTATSTGGGKGDKRRAENEGFWDYYPCTDDVIEEFSSQEEDELLRLRGISSSKQSHSVCNTSKLSLRGCGILSTQSSGKSKHTAATPSFNLVSPVDTEINSNKMMLPRLTINPIRKIQFIDSDSDTSSPVNERSKDSKVKNGSDSNQKHILPDHSQTSDPSQISKPAALSDKNITESLWKDFLPKNSVDFATPALDEFCEEYFNSFKNSSNDHCKEGHRVVSNSNALGSDNFTGDLGDHQKDGISWDMAYPKPPSYQYIFHGDIRIRKLVKDRLVNYCALGFISQGFNQPHGIETLNYMLQFGPREASSNVPRSIVKASQKGSRKKKKTNAVTNAYEHLEASRSGVNHTKAVEGSRTRGSGPSSGYWYTEQDGKKAYVTKNGQVLQGKIAYIHYSKESGAGYRKTKKKSAPKKAKTKNKKSRNSSVLDWGDKHRQ